MNHKGQVLVLFLLLLPILLLIMGLVIDVGNLFVEQKKSENVVKSAIRYGLSSEENQEEKARQYLEENLSNSSFRVFYSNQTLTIQGNVKIESLFSKLFQRESVSFELKYQGVKEKEKVTIRKVR